LFLEVGEEEQMLEEVVEQEDLDYLMVGQYQLLLCLLYLHVLLLLVLQLKHIQLQLVGVEQQV
jgi:hypothetical protein